MAPTPTPYPAGDGSAEAGPPRSGPAEDSFRRRASLYADANRGDPDARSAEWRRLLAPVRRLSGRVLDLQAASGYVADAVRRRAGPAVELVSVEPSASLARTLDRRHGPVRARLDALPFADGSFDVALCLAGTHHSPDLEAIVREVRRLLVPGGEVSLAEVECGSAMDHWLNGFVDRQSPDGHAGRFVRPGEITEALERCGFDAVREERVSVPWVFPGERAMVEFCRRLFGLSRASGSTVRAGLFDHLPVAAHGTGMELGWQLRYAYGRAPTR